MFKINNEKARGELTQNLKCQPVLKHFGRGSSGKTRWRYLLYGLQLVCVNAITPQPSASAKTQGPNSSWDAELGTTHLRSEGKHLPAPQPLNPSRASTTQSLPGSAWAALLGFSGEPQILVTVTSVCICRQVVQPTVFHTTYPRALQEHTDHGHTSPIRSFKDFTSRMAEWIKSNDPQQCLAQKNGNITTTAN